MIKVFRVYQNHSNIGSYYNKWVCNKDYDGEDNMPDIEALPYYDKVIEVQGNIMNKRDKLFVYRFILEGDDFMLYSAYLMNSETEDPIASINNIMFDVAKYIRLNYKDELISGNLTRLLTHFLANYFKKYEDMAQKDKKINHLKQGLANVQEIATHTFMTIVERGKAIGELQTEMETISYHGHMFNSKTKCLKNKMWSQKVQAYLYSLALLLIFVTMLYILF